MELTIKSAKLYDIMEALKAQQETAMKLNQALSAFFENIEEDDWIVVEQAEAMTGKNRRQLKYLADKGLVKVKKLSDRKSLYRLSDIIKLSPNSDISKDLADALECSCERDHKTDWIPIELAVAFTGAGYRRLKKLAASGVLSVRMGKEGKLLFSLQELKGKKSKAWLDAD